MFKYVVSIFLVAPVLSVIFLVLMKTGIFSGGGGFGDLYMGMGGVLLIFVGAIIAPICMSLFSYSLKDHNGYNNKKLKKGRS